MIEVHSGKTKIHWPMGCGGQRKKDQQHYLFFYNIWLLIYAFCLKLAQPIGTISMVFTSTEQSDWLNQTQ